MRVKAAPSKLLSAVLLFQPPATMKPTLESYTPAAHFRDSVMLEAMQFFYLSSKVVQY